MVVLGVVVLLAAPHRHMALVLELFAPLAAAAALSMIWGPESDPSIELVVTTGTSPRDVLLARLVLVSVYDIALGLIATRSPFSRPPIWDLEISSLYGSDRCSCSQP